MSTLAQVYLWNEQAAEGLQVLAEALAVGHEHEEGAEKAERYRLQGELMLQAPGQSQESRINEAETCFQQAIEIARQQSAKSWELRAATSLARLWQQQGKRVEARDLLAPVYEWFTEGFDTQDLKDAKALLDALP